MKPDTLERLLWEQAEGTISAEDRSRLDAELASDPTAERQRRGVKAVAELLTSVGEVTPPPSLHARIETALAARPRPRPRFSFTAMINEVLVPQWRVRIAWAVVGLVVGMTATALIVADFGHTSREDISRFYGSMATLDTAGAAALEVALPDALGTLTLSARDAMLTVDLEVARPVAGGVAVEVAGAGLAVVSFRAGTAAGGRVDASAEAVVATADGAGHLTTKIGLPTRTGVLSVRVAVAGKTVVERGLDVSKVSGE
jgi:hypothetical protein